MGGFPASGVGDGCMESVQFVSQVHGRCSVKLVLGTGGVCEIYHCHFSLYLF